ncbi:hypothetical protein [Chitinophaga sp.]|uniref:hypothetical protein n=1 Tax=Chitinophaga sp. TaxID=1869181 RepID=UPI0031DD04C0
MWDKVTVGQFQQLYDIQQGNFELEVDRQVHLLSCLDGKPIEHYESMLLTDLMKECERTKFLSIGDVPVIPTPREITVNGQVYRPLYEFRDVVAGQFIDVMSVAKTPDENILNLHRMLAAICRPVKDKKIQSYGSIPFDDVAEAMLQLPIVQALAISNFFFDAWNRFLKVIPGYLERKMKKGKRLTEMEQIIHGLALVSAGGGY